MNKILDYIRTAGVEYAISRDNEVYFRLPELPDYIAYLSAFEGQIWCDLHECYSGGLVRSYVTENPAKAINLARLSARNFETQLEMNLADHPSWRVIPYLSLMLAVSGGFWRCGAIIVCVYY